MPISLLLYPPAIRTWHCVAYFKWLLYQVYVNVAVHLFFYLSIKLISQYLSRGENRAGLLPARRGEKEKILLVERPWRHHGETPGAERARPTGKCMYLGDIGWEVARFA